MKKIMFILMLISFCFNLGFAKLVNTFKLRGVLIDGTTTYSMIQKKDSWIATREAEYPTGTTTFSYQVGYSSTTATAFWSVISSTDNWITAQEAASL